MALIRQIKESEAQGILKEVYDSAVSRSGQVANIIKVMSLDARTVRASMKFYTALMKSKNALEPARREMLAAVVSNVNECYY